MAVLVPKTAVVQGSLAHYVSSLVYNKPIQESFHSDRGEGYVNKHTAQDDEQSSLGLRLKAAKR